MANSDTLKNHLCGFNLSLKRGSDEGVEMGTLYKALMEELLTSETIATEAKVFPVIFHVITKGGVEVATSGEMDFDPSYILEHVNSWFTGTLISFAPALLDPQGNMLSTPGLNIIDGLEVTESRTFSGIDGSLIHTYRNDMVAVTSNYNENEEIPGVTLDHIYSTYRWSIEGQERYLNVFVVNRLKTSTNPTGRDSSVYMTSEHPYVAEQLDELSSFNCAIEFSGLGRSYADRNGTPFEKGGPSDSVTNFGYTYKKKDEGGVDYPSFTYKGGLGNEEGFRDRGRSLAHCFGHMLGLSHPKTEIGSPSTQCGGSDEVYSDTISEGVAYSDGLSDTVEVQKGESGVLYSTYNSLNSCSTEGNTVFTDSSTHMTLSQREGLPMEELGGPSTLFTTKQIEWMHANCEIEFEGESGFQPGILKGILVNSNLTIPNIIDLSGDPCVTDPRSFRSSYKSDTSPTFNNIEKDLSIFIKLRNALQKLNL